MRQQFEADPPAAADPASADEHAQSEDLDAEARYFHQAFFPGPIPEAVVSRYIAANRYCFPRISPQDRQLLRMIVTRKLDVEAVEYVLRLRRRHLVLTRKIQILFYLVEVRAEYYRHFVSQTSGRGPADLRLAGSLLRTLWKFLKGSFLVWRYAIA